MKNILIFTLFSMLSCIFANEKSLIINNFDFAGEISSSKVLDIPALSKIIHSIPEFTAFSVILESKGYPIKKSIKGVTISGNYHQEPAIIFNTKIDERAFLDIIKNKNPETYLLDGRRIHKYFANNKSIFSSYIQPNILLVTANPNIFKKLKFSDLNEELKTRFSISEDKNRILSFIFKNISGINSKDRQQTITENNPLILKAFHETVLLVNNKDDKNIEVSAFVAYDPKTEQLVKFQINTLFLLISAHLSKGNQKLASEMTNSFKMTDIKPGLLQAYFSFDANSIESNKILPFDPFSTEK